MRKARLNNKFVFEWDGCVRCSPGFHGLVTAGDSLCSCSDKEFKLGRPRLVSKEEGVR